MGRVGSRRAWRRGSKAAVAAVTVVGTLALTIGVAGAWGRYAGDNRYDTAWQLNRYVGEDGGNTVFASGETFNDALAASFLAGQAPGGRLLLTQTAQLPPGDTYDSLDDIGNGSQAGKLFVVDGHDQITDAAVQQIESRYNQLRTQDYEPKIPATRVSGSNAFTAAAAVATYPGTTVGSTSALGRTAILATVANYPDALAASPIVYSQRFPLLYATRDSVPPATGQALAQLEIDTVVLVGGTAVLGETVESSLQSAGYTTRRLSGATRQHTANQIAQFAIAELGFQNDTFALARGDGFADALAGGSRAGEDRYPILLAGVPDDTLPEPTRKFIADRCALYTSSFVVFGGRAAVTDTTANLASRAAGSC